MKYLKKISSILIVMAVFAASFAASLQIFSQGTYAFDAKDLAIVNDDVASYYLRGANKNINFKVYCEDGARLIYTIIDEDDNDVETKIEKISDTLYNIKSPKGGYKEGFTYTLELSEGVTFESTELANARTLYFTIEKPTVEKYKYTDNVIKVEKKLEKAKDDTINVIGLDLNIGDVIVGQDEDGQYFAYKITQLLSDGIANITTPTIDEIYSELEVYDEYTCDAGEIIVNPYLEREIENNVKNSSFYKSLISTAYADESESNGDVKVKVKPDNKKKSITFEITITLKPGQNGLFNNKRLKNQQVSILLSSEMSLSVKGNFQNLEKWDFSSTITNKYSWDLEITPYTSGEKYKDSKDSEAVINDLESLKTHLKTKSNSKIINSVQNELKDVTEKLNNVAADASSGEIKIFDWDVPVPSVPGLYYSAEIKFFANFEMSANAKIGSSFKTTTLTGFCHKNNNAIVYSNFTVEGDKNNASLSGKAKAKEGVKLIAKATFINNDIANINLEPQIGLYQDFFAVVPVENLESISNIESMYCYFEFGAYLSANVNASLIKTFDYSFELAKKEYPLVKFGRDTIALGLKVDHTDIYTPIEKFDIPEIKFEYFDVKTGKKTTEAIDLAYISFTSANGPCKVKNGKLVITDTAPDDTQFWTNILVSYTHPNGVTYTDNFPVYYHMGADDEEWLDEDVDDELCWCGIPKSLGHDHLCTDENGNHYEEQPDGSREYIGMEDEEDWD